MQLAGIWRHCILCNERMETLDVDTHLSTEKHRKKKESASVLLNTDKKLYIESLEINGMLENKFKRNEDNKLNKIEKVDVAETTIDPIKKSDVINVNNCIIDNELKMNQVTNISNYNEKDILTDVAVCRNELMNDNLEEYIALIKDKVMSKHSVTALDDNYIQLKTENGDAIKVTIKNFHGYLSSESTYTHCYLCAKYLFGNEIMEHKYTIEHINRVMLPIHDVHCMRQLENGFHCVLCNTRVDKACYHSHIEAQNHSGHLKEAVMYRAKSLVSERKETEIKIYPSVTNNKKLMETYCEVCNLNIQTHNMKSHIESKKHKINDKNKSHNKTGSSRIKFTSILKESNTNVTNVTYCDVCCVDIDTHNMISHIGGKTHKANLSVKSSSVENFNVKTGITHCDVCNMGIHTHNMNSHINGSKHKLNSTVNTSEKSNINDTPVTHSYVQNVGIHNINSCENEYDHDNLSVTNIEDPNSVESNTKKEVIHYQMEFPLSSNDLTCIVCNVKVPNHTSNVNEHIKGQSHKAKYISLMKINTLTSTENGYTCNACKTHITLTTELLHINDLNHKLKLNSPSTAIIDMNSTFCNLCKVHVGVNNMVNHVLGKAHKQTVKNTLKPDSSTVHPMINDLNQGSIVQPIIKSAKSDSAIVQHITISAKPDSSIVQHITISSNPDSSVEKPITKSSNETRHYCEICKTAVPNSPYNIETHYKGRRHASNLKLESITIDKKNKYLCKACDIEISEPNVIGHIKHQDHCNNIRIHNVSANSKCGKSLDSVL